MNSKVRTGLILIVSGIGVGIAPGLLPCQGSGCSNRAGLLVTLPLGLFAVISGVIYLVVGLREKPVSTEANARRQRSSSLLTKIGGSMLAVPFVSNIFMSTFSNQGSTEFLVVFSYLYMLCFFGGPILLVVGFAIRPSRNKLQNFDEKSSRAES